MKEGDAPSFLPLRGLRATDCRAWLVVIAMTLALTAITTCQSFTRYREFRSGFSWDLAYYNQWFWAMTRGDGLITVRPLSAYAEEGPSVWKTNYIAPIRFVILPIYALFPGPRTLLLVQNVMFWWMIPAAYTLVRSESKSQTLAVTGAALTPLTPIAWPLVWNDFRELQLSIPFVLWAIQGWRARNRGVATAGVAGMLACRQEFALVVASLAIVPAREPESADHRRRWALAALLIGIAWFTVVFLPYLSWQVGPHAPADYLAQFAGSSASMRETVDTALDFLIVGLGSWTALAVLAPRVAVLAMPWLWSLSHGRWALHTIETDAWHHVRYAAPMTALLLAAALVGYARVGAALWRRPRRGSALAALLLVTIAGLTAPNVSLQLRFAEVPRPIPLAESDRLRQWIDHVGPDDGVLAAYEVAAPLSSRRSLYSYRLDENKPTGYPRLAPSIRWAFVRTGDISPQLFLGQGFALLSSGPTIQVFRR
jgi:hypothetical protein